MQTSDKYILTTSYKSPYGELLIGSFRDQLVLCDWKFRKMRDAVDDRIKDGLQADFMDAESEITRKTVEQLETYFAGKLEQFSMPLLTVGSAFQRKVWDLLRTIPYGETRSYLDLSKMAGNEEAIRAVAAANGANAISIIIPCHRIIGSDGSLTGYAGGLSVKKRLLKMEGKDRGDEQLELFD